jgi:putative FmdB family regulatory protein
MPIYEYYCEKCGKVEEVWCKMTEHPELTCSVCHGQTHRIPSVPNHKYIGYGFYKTDYPTHYCKREKDEELRKLGKLPPADADTK